MMTVTLGWGSSSNSIAHLHIYFGLLFRNFAEPKELVVMFEEIVVSSILIRSPIIGFSWRNFFSLNFAFLNSPFSFLRQGKVPYDRFFLLGLLFEMDYGSLFFFKNFDWSDFVIILLRVIVCFNWRIQMSIIWAIGVEDLLRQRVIVLAVWRGIVRRWWEKSIIKIVVKLKRASIR